MFLKGGVIIVVKSITIDVIVIDLTRLSYK